MRFVTDDDGITAEITPLNCPVEAKNGTENTKFSGLFSESAVTVEGVSVELKLDSVSYSAFKISTWDWIVDILFCASERPPQSPA